MTAFVNADENHNDTLFHTCWDSYNKKKKEKEKKWKEERKGRRKALFEPGKICTLVHCGQESKVVQSLWKTIQQLLKRLNVERPEGLAIPRLGIHPKELNRET